MNTNVREKLESAFQTYLAQVTEHVRREPTHDELDAELAEEIAAEVIVRAIKGCPSAEELDNYLSTTADQVVSDRLRQYAYAKSLLAGESPPPPEVAEPPAAVPSAPKATATPQQEAPTAGEKATAREAQPAPDGDPFDDDWTDAAEASHADAEDDGGASEGSADLSAAAPSSNHPPEDEGALDAASTPAPPPELDAPGEDDVELASEVAPEVVAGAPKASASVDLEAEEPFDDEPAPPASEPSPVSKSPRSRPNVTSSFLDAPAVEELPVARGQADATAPATVPPPASSRRPGSVTPTQPLQARSDVNVPRPGSLPDDLSGLACAGFPDNPLRTARLCLVSLADELGFDPRELLVHASEVAEQLEALVRRHQTPEGRPWPHVDLQTEWQRIARRATLRAAWRPR